MVFVAGDGVDAVVMPETLLDGGSGREATGASPNPLMASGNDAHTCKLKHNASHLQYLTTRI
jgi:hypothetical protein